ncbi:MAG: protein kinase [Planctomycetaceae bacterium]|nr:protein kinase [Planctomycetaceae bacterium]HCK42587.1 serine/threonine protein kinase [Planctomycetaceae bacterium]
MTEDPKMIPPEDGYQQIDAKDTDRELSKYFSNNFNRYSSFAPLGKGGSAELRVCHDNNLGRVVVMKTLHPHLANHVYMKARFLREARVTAQLQHPNTVPVYEIGNDIQGRLYFTMKKVEGETLRDILEKQILGDSEAIRVYNLDRMLGVIIQICNALSYAHVHGVVHRDVKPENILIGTFGEVLLLDWGVAKVWAMEDDELEQGIRAHEELTDIGQRPGTPLYMSPEQVRGGGAEIDLRTDIYSIGVVLYEILTLKEPHRGERINETFDMIINEETIPPEQRTPTRNIQQFLSRITMRALEKSPADRYQTMQELVEALRDFRSQAFQSLTGH